ncbi:signal peptidase I [Candidatus Uhrbacteria bacterium CG10_big_fil_rev_8_21_14_0_10_48_16]|uniref:Signal peptidase I n=1 Tax=Candidatus Uhrbacteria bacterium CG10_big_fil_rev_8_21_14_0_10_48_16 TaxID=1975038 RepID=A0A2M8LH22_9BACT|nr:MAG: signal peptidase I [Candidatus Uhrbacteria bacterium CG10_big_fil_rev_8_21_14_0_10_48_16]
MQARFSSVEEKLYKRFGPVGGAVASFLFEVVQIVLISSAIIIPIRYFLIQPFYVKGASMEPNFYDHEYLIIDELTYRFRDPFRGEILVFRYPRDPSQFFIKRIVGLPGETVEITGGNVIIYNVEHPNGLVLEEEYLDDEQTNGKVRVTLGEDEYYVFGDNRDASLDSRSFGPIQSDDVIGRVWVRGLPFSRMGTFDLPEYNL